MRGPVWLAAYLFFLMFSLVHCINPEKDYSNLSSEEKLNIIKARDEKQEVNDVLSKKINRQNESQIDLNSGEVEGYITELETLTISRDNMPCKFDKFGNINVLRLTTFNIGGVYFDETSPNQLIVFCKESGNDCFKSHQGMFEKGLQIRTLDKKRTKELLLLLGKAINKEIEFRSQN